MNPKIAEVVEKITSIRMHLESTGAHKDYLEYCTDITAALQVIAAVGGEVYRCDFCGKDYTKAKYCCQSRREYLNAHGEYETAVGDSRAEFEKWYADTFPNAQILSGYRRDDGGYYGDFSNAMWKAWQAAQPSEAVVDEAKPKELAELQASDNLYHVNLTCAELQAACDFGNPDKSDEGAETEMCIGYFKEGHSGPGYYVWYLEYPEEGCMKLTQIDAAISAGGE